jgi:hypothetical protein
MWGGAGGEGLQGRVKHSPTCTQNQEMFRPPLLAPTAHEQRSIAKAVRGAYSPLGRAASRLFLSGRGTARARSTARQFLRGTGGGPRGQRGAAAAGCRGRGVGGVQGPW